MKKILPQYGIEVTEIPRCTAPDGTVISATQVRRLFLSGCAEELKPFVPKTTYAFLTSSEGQALKKQLLEEKDTRS